LLGLLVLGLLPIHKEALRDDLKAHGAADLHQRGLLGVALAGFAHVHTCSRIRCHGGLCDLIVCRRGVLKVFQARRSIF
jgi:hypothetical protein